MSADPAGPVDGLNLFRMVRNNPVSFIDHDGRVPAKLSDAEFQSVLPKPAINYARWEEYRLTRSVSLPTTKATMKQTGDEKNFLGYHGTNERSAKNILANVLANDQIPNGQIGQGFYILKTDTLLKVLLTHQGRSENRD